MTSPAPAILWTEDRQTWSVNAGFYGTLYDPQDRDVTAYSSEWHATEGEAQAVLQRHQAIVAGLEAHAPANPYNTRRYRLAITPNPDGTLTVREYDWNLFRFEIPASLV